MQAIPSRPVAGGHEQLTGIACPDCPGVLVVSTENDHLRFRCRIGHVYSLQDLIEAKERRLEDLLLAPTTTLDELATLLREAVAMGRAIGSPEHFEARAARALRHAAVIRAVIEENEPTRLDGGGDAPPDRR
jgi:two-component system chemotaxis response regulator CheB